MTEMEVTVKRMHIRAASECTGVLRTCGMHLGVKAQPLYLQTLGPWAGPRPRPRQCVGAWAVGTGACGLGPRHWGPGYLPLCNAWTPKGSSWVESEQRAGFVLG